MRAAFVRRSLIFILSLPLVGLLGSCFGDTTPPQPVSPQGWDDAQRAAWYGGKQGSRLMPYAWFKALERAEDQSPFASAASLARFRFLARTDQPLPVGFAVDDNDDSRLTFSKLRWFDGQGARENWVGLNCAACHTSEIAFGDKPPLRIDGGPALVDFQAFTRALDQALVATRDDPAKWDRFARAVLAPDRDNAANRELLKAAFARYWDWQQRTAKLDATTLQYGPGRLDAVGRIFNKVALFSQSPDPIVNPPDAPVSFPFLWDIWRQDKLQWNGIAQSARLKLGGGRFLDYGALGRNTGEVIGVFGDVDTSSQSTFAGFRSSVWADNLDRIEEQLRLLKAPAWPAALFPQPAPADAQRIADLQARGRDLFGRNCASCHGSFGPEVNQYKVVMVRLSGPERERTDPWMACNAYTYNARSGVLAGVKEGYFNGRALGPIEPTGTLLATMVKGTLVGKKGQILKQAGNTILGVNRPPVALPQEFPDTPEGRIAARLQRCLTDDNELLAYKARPLDGIWATAPYLHNGSVPSLYDLMLPAAQRPRSFKTGTRQYDPVNVGFVTGAAPGNDFTFDTGLRGNSNMGHDYGVGSLNETDRRALVEYMKTL